MEEERDEAQPTHWRHRLHSVGVHLPIPASVDDPTDALLQALVDKIESVTSQRAELSQAIQDKDEIVCNLEKDLESERRKRCNVDKRLCSVEAQLERVQQESSHAQNQMTQELQRMDQSMRDAQMRAERSEGRLRSLDKTHQELKDRLQKQLSKSDPSIKHGLRVLTRARQRDAQRDDEAVARARRTGVHSMTVAHMSSTSESSSSVAGAKLFHRTVQSLEDRCAMLVAENQAMSSLVGRMNRHLQLLNKQCLAICHASQNPVVDGTAAQEEQEEDVETEAECGVDPETGARLDKVEEALRTLFLSFRPDSADPDAVSARTPGNVIAGVDTVRPDAHRRGVLEEAFMDGMQAVKEDIRALENALRHGHDGKPSPIDHFSAAARSPSDSQVREAMEELEGMRAQVAAALRVIRRQDSLLQFAVHRPTPSPQFRDVRGDSAAAAAAMVAARSTPSSHNDRARTQPSTVVEESSRQTKRSRRQLAASEMPTQEGGKPATAFDVSKLPVPASPATAAILESILGGPAGVDDAEEHERVGSTGAETRGHETPENEDEHAHDAGTGGKEAENREPAPVESARLPPGKGMPLRLKQRLDARRKHVGKAARSFSHTGRTTKRALQGGSNGL